MAVKLLIFDCFGVICHESAPCWLERHFTLEESRMYEKTLIHDADSGKISGKEMFRKFSELCGEDALEIEKDWIDFAAVNENMVAMIKDLRKNYKTALLSNAVSGIFPQIFTEAQLDEMFDVKVISHIEKCAKPDPKIYGLVLERAGVKGEEAVFTDDNPANLEVAKTLGIKTIHFKNQEDYLEQLKNM